MAGSTEQLLCIDGPVRLFASQDEAEPAFLDEGKLCIYINPGNHVKAQVNEVFWTLSTTAVACVRVTHHAFSFSIPECPGMYITTVLPASISNEELHTVTDVLSATCDYYDQRDGTAGRTAPPIATAPPPGGAITPVGQADRSAAAEAGAEAVAVAAGESRDYEHAGKFALVGHMAATLVHVAGEATSHALMYGADYITKNVAPAARDASVSDSTLQRLDSARLVASRVASITSSVAEGVARMTVSAATSIATQVSNTSVGRSVGNSSLSHAVVAGVSALDEVLQAMEDAGLQVVQSLATATTTVVQHRYGPDAARAAGLGMGTAVHVAEAQRHLSKLRPTRIARKTARQVAHRVAAGSSGMPTARPTTSINQSSPPSVVIEEVTSDPPPSAAPQLVPAVESQQQQGGTARPTAVRPTTEVTPAAAVGPATGMGVQQVPVRPTLQQVHVQASAQQVPGQVRPTATHSPVAQPPASADQYMQSSTLAVTPDTQHAAQQQLIFEPNYPIHPARRPGYYPNVPA